MHENLWELTSIKTERERSPEVIVNDQRALAKIGLSIKRNIQPYIQDCQTANQAYDILCKTFGTQGLISRISILRQLCTVNLNHAGNMDDYIGQILSLTQKLSDMEKPLEDDFIAALMLAGLPDDYQPLVMALEHSTSNITSEIVKSKLLQESTRRKSSSSENTSFIVKQTKRCNICRRTNHTTAQHVPKKPSDSSKHQKKEKSTNISLLTAMSANVSTSTFVIDSGANVHICSRRDYFTDIEEKPLPSVKLASKQRASCQGQGNVHLDIDKDKSVTIEDAYYSSELDSNLLSVSKMVKKGYSVLFDNSGCSVRSSSGKTVLKAEEQNGLYVLNQCSQVQANTVHKNSTTKKLSQELWHARLGHLNCSDMESLRAGDYALGIDYSPVDLSKCITCIESKHRRLPVPRYSDSRATDILQLVHTDIAVVNVPSNGGAVYAVIFVDDYSRKTYIYPMKRKSETFEKFKEFHSYAELQTGRKLKCIRSDNGSEYFSNDFQFFLKRHGIRHESSVKYTPEQNGVAEATNKTIFQRVRCMLKNANLPKGFWAEAAAAAVYVKNRSPTAALQNSTPEGMWTGKPVDLSNLRVFGCIAYERVDGLKHKLDSRSKKFIFVGYSETQKGGYRLADPANPRYVHVGRNVIFLEDTFQSGVDSTEIVYIPVSDTIPVADNSQAEPGETNPPAEVESPFSPELDSEYVPSDLNSSDTIAVDHSQFSPPVTRSRVLQAPVANEDESHDLLTYHVAAVDGDEPTTAKEALARQDGDFWKKAMEEELEAMRKNNVYTIVDKPPNQKIVGSRWVFKIKRNANGTIERYKARLVARGFSQVTEQETYSPVMRYSTLKFLLALSTQDQMSISHYDVQCAFLHGELEEPVFMQQPEGFSKGNSKVCFLKKALYGLKNAGRAWYEKLSETLLSLNFERSKIDACVFILREKKKMVILGIWVDDILLISNDPILKGIVKNKIFSKFDMRDLGEPTNLLGLHIAKKDGVLTIDQTHYINNMLHKFEMSNCKPCLTPMEVGLHFSPGDVDSNVPYRELIGSLLWLSTCTRPDITYATNKLASFTSCPTSEHWNAAKRVLRYLRGTKEYKLTYCSDGTSRLTGYSDSDWAGDHTDRRSTTGYVFMMNGGPIAWESKRQKTTALSTCEAEYMALAETSKEALFLRSLYKSIYKADIQIKIYEDNQSAIKLAENPMINNRTKHIETRHHFVRECLQNNSFTLDYAPTNEMTADILTKALATSAHQKCVSKLGLTKSK